MPSVTPAATAGAVLILMTAMNELTLSALLWSSGHETIGVMVFSLQYEGNSTAAPRQFPFCPRYCCLHYVQLRS